MHFCLGVSPYRQRQTSRLHHAMAETTGNDVVVAPPLPSCLIAGLTTSDG